MARLLSADGVLLGRLSSYTIGKELHRAADEGAVYLARNLSGEKCISETPFLRPLVDNINDPANPPSIVLHYLDGNILTESNKKRLPRPEIKQVAQYVLEVLRLLHKDNIAHTDIKLDNIFVNYSQGNQYFSNIQLSDYRGVVSQDSSFAKEGHIIGATFTHSPEATFQLL
ncbi:hypothetical protein OQA88_10712 [Cercophora sp. LCS_1]